MVYARTTNNKKKSKKSVIFWIAFASILAVGLYFLWQFLSGAYMSNGFYDGTTINGVDVSNLTSEQASNIIAAKLNEKRNEVEIELTYKDKSWKFEGKDFEVNPDILPIIESAYQYGRGGNFVEKLSTAKEFKTKDLTLRFHINMFWRDLIKKLTKLSVK